MKVYKSIKELPQFKQSVLTIGSFDGLHIGHQKIIQKVRMKAKENGLESVVVTFCPHPRQILFPGDTDFSLLSVNEEKIRLFERMGIDHLVMFPFTIEFSRITPGEYIEDFIVRYFNPAYIIIGYDHRFGLNRNGDIFLLNKMAPKFNFKVVEIEKQEIEENVISSTRIRKAIAEGDIALARAYSNHNYLLSGKVVYGYKYGRKMGFPTANLEPVKEKLVPGDGVYAVKVFMENDTYAGMMYIGNKPSFKDNLERVIEVHIFDFNFDIYGSEITVELIERIRTSRKFDSSEALQKQLMKDREEALVLIKENEAFQEKIPRVAVVILNYNGRDYLEEYLPSVIQPGDIPVKYIVADNGSTDDSIDFIRKYYPEIEVHELENNYGFAEGYNRVIRSISNHEYIVFLNSDVETEAGWLDPIIEEMDDDPAIGVAQPKILSYDEKEKFEYAGAAGGYIDMLGYPFCRGRIFDVLETDDGQYNDTREVFWSSGAAMVMRKSVYDKFGGFDSSFFAHQEEIDLCWRIKKAGYKVMAIGDSWVYHLGGGTLSYVNPHKYYLNFRNNLMMILKNESSFKLIWMLPFRLILDGVAGMKFLVDGNAKSTLAIIRAHFNVYGQLLSIFRKRKKIKRIVRANKIGDARKTGMYKGIIIWDHFIRKIQKFSDLKIDDQES